MCADTTTAPDAATYLRVREAAATVNIHPSTVYRAIDRGNLPATKIEGAWRINLAAWVAYQNRRSTGGT